MQKIRLDQLLMQRNLAENLSQAQRLVMAGQVRVNGELELAPAARLDEDAQVVIDLGPRYVSRGGEKLEAALLAFGLNSLRGAVCADVGASTGGFTDCLLQHGAGHVFAVDVGYGELHWKLRNDERVTVMERTNARHVRGFALPVELVTVDASFISLKTLLPVCAGWFGERPGGLVALIKPQFEARRRQAARGEGVIRDPQVHRQVLREVLQHSQALGFGVRGLLRSPLHGPKGNVEFLMHAVWREEAAAPLEDWIQAAVG